MSQNLINHEQIEIMQINNKLMYLALPLGLCIIGIAAKLFAYEIGAGVSGPNCQPAGTGGAYYLSCLQPDGTYGPTYGPFYASTNAGSCNILSCNFNGNETYCGAPIGQFNCSYSVSAQICQSGGYTYYKTTQYTAKGACSQPTIY